MSDTTSMIFAVEAFIVDLQCAFHDRMRIQKISRSELAKMMDVPLAKINDFFGDNCVNMKPHDLAEMAFALGYEIDLKLRPVAGSNYETK